LANEAKTRIKEVTPLKANEIVKQGAVLLDVREKDEFEQNHLPRVKHLGRGILEMKVDEIVPDKSAPIVWYCAGGDRGALAVDTLQKMGYSNVVSDTGRTQCLPHAGSKVNGMDEHLLYPSTVPEQLNGWTSQWPLHRASMSGGRCSSPRTFFGHLRSLPRARLFALHRAFHRRRARPGRQHPEGHRWETTSPPARGKHSHARFLKKAKPQRACHRTSVEG